MKRKNKFIQTKYFTCLLVFLLVSFCNISNAQTLGLLSKSISASSAQAQGQKVATDAYGNVYQTGIFNSVISFGAYTLTPASTSFDVFIVKYNNVGVVQWAKRAGGTGSDVPAGLSVLDGNVYVSGTFENTMNFNTPSATGTNEVISAGGKDIFLAKFDDQGNFIWAKRCGGSDVTGEGGGKLAIAQSSIYIVGSFETSMNFNTPSSTSTNTLTTTSSTDQDAFVAKFDTTGNFVWARKIGGNGTQSGIGITAIDTSVYISGSTISNPTYFYLNAIGSNAITLNGNTGRATFLAKYNSSGLVQWAKLGVGFGVKWASSISVIDTSVYICGIFEDSLLFNVPSVSINDKIYGAGGYDAFLAKYNTSGTFVWAKRAGSASIYTEQATAIVALDSSVYICGQFQDTANFNTPSASGSNEIIESTGGVLSSSDGFVAKYNNMGNVQWLKRMGGSSGDYCNDIAVTPTSIYAIGGFGGTANFNTPISSGNDTLSTVALRESFITLFSTSAFCTPSINITASATTICAGTSVTFTATPTNGGTTPTYQWKINSANVGTNTSTFTSSTLVNSDVVTCEMISNATCASPTNANSNNVVMIVNTIVIPNVNITASATTICANTSVTFTATPTNGGTTPSYQWKINGANVGANTSTFTSNTLVNADVVTCEIISNATCASPTNTTSNNVTMIVNATVIPSINITASATTICANTSVTFTATPTNGGTTPTYQWKINGANVGANANTFTSNTLANSDVVTCEITSNASCASPTNATSNNVSMIVNAVVIPSIFITASATTICAGTSVIFSATPTNGGTTPTYQWKINGANVGTNASTFTSNTLANSHVVTCEMISNATCASPTNATSNNVSMIVNATLIPSVNITASATTICAGTSVIFTATPTNGGTTPSYQWKINGANVGANASTFTSATLANSDVVTCVVTSNATCASPTNATSNNVSMIVNATVIPSVNITANATTICANTSVTFTATATNGGTTPTYQWKINGGNVGTNASTFTSATLANSDVVTCVVTSNATCASPTNATSNNVSMIVNATLIPSVNITASATTICAGTSVIFTATPTNGGTTPTYQWKINGANVGTNASTFTSNTLVNSDVVTCVVTSNATCASPTNATSNNVSMIVNAVVIPSVNITASATTICANTSVTFTASPTNGGTTPSYQWKINGTNVGTNATTFTSSTLANADVVTCEMISNATCASPLNATSNNVTMIVNATVIPSVNVTASATTICANTSVTFTATPTNGGTTPSYQWKINGANVGANASTFTSATLANSDVVTCVVTSNATCASPTNATSNNVTMIVNAVVIPSINITASANTICANTSVTFTATPTNGGTTPTYQWKINGANVGANTSTFTSNTLANSDVVTCEIISNATCASPTNAISNNVAMIVNTVVIPSVNITASATTICANTSVTFTATPTNGGTTPTYQWKINGANVGANASTFTSSTLANSDVVACEIISNATCASPTNATSNNVVMVITTVNNGLTISGNVLTATQSGASYQWINCNTQLPIVGATNQNFTPTTSGLYQVNITLNGCSAKSNCQNFVPESIDEIQDLIGVDIYPNPASDFITINIKEYKNSNIKIVDMTGKEILSAEGKQIQNINVGSCANGNYLIIISNAKNNTIYKIVINR
jgi:Secretion system C-terminal sorting domain